MALFPIRLHTLLRSLVPGRCLLCDGPLPPDRRLDLCGFCTAALPWNSPACARCAVPLAAGRGPCGDCLRRPPPFRFALAPLRYESYAGAWVRQLKDGLGLVEGRVLGLLLASAAAAAYAPGGAAPRLPDYLVPVPLRARRLAARGHNQALTLALPVAQRLRVPVLRHALTRTRAAPSQRGLGRAARRHNLQGAFRSRAWTASARAPDGPCVAVVDDVLTTGATATELALTLLAAGAAEVHVLAATRTPRG